MGIENNPQGNSSVTLTTPGQGEQYCSFNESFPHLGVARLVNSLYINAVEGAGAVDITSIDFERWKIVPTPQPTTDPTSYPTRGPTNDPTTDPTTNPTTNNPTTDPTIDPTSDPTSLPTNVPTEDTDAPTVDPTDDPTSDPTTDPTIDPTTDPTIDPTMDPTFRPTPSPTQSPTYYPTHKPTRRPTPKPTPRPKPTTPKPTRRPTEKPTQNPTDEPAVIDQIALGAQQGIIIVGFIGGLVCLFCIVTVIQYFVIKKEKKKIRLSAEEDRDGDGILDEFDVEGLKVFEEDEKKLIEKVEKQKKREKKVEEWIEENEEDGLIMEVPVDPELSWDTRELIRAKFEAQFEGSNSSDF